MFAYAYGLLFGNEEDCLDIMRKLSDYFHYNIVLVIIFVVCISGALMRLAGFRRGLGSVLNASGMLLLWQLAMGPTVQNYISALPEVQEYIRPITCILETEPRVKEFLKIVLPALVLVWICINVVRYVSFTKHFKSWDCVRVTINMDRSDKENEIDFSFVSISEDRTTKDVFGEVFSSQSAGRYKKQVVDQQSFWFESLRRRFFRLDPKCFDPFVPLDSTKYEDREVFRRIRATIEGIHGHASLHSAMEPPRIRRQLKQKVIVVGMAYERQHDSQVNSTGDYDLFQIMAIEESQLKKIWKFGRTDTDEHTYDFADYFSGPDGMVPAGDLDDTIEKINEDSARLGLPQLNFSDPPTFHERVENATPVNKIRRRQKLTRFRTMVRMAEKWFGKAGVVKAESYPRIYSKSGLSSIAVLHSTINED